MVTEKQKANLRPIKNLSHEEAKRRGSIGGKKSVEKRRQLKTWGTILKIMLSTPESEQNQAILEKVGIEQEDATLQTNMLYNRIFMPAMKGDKWAIEMLAKCTDNFGAQKIDINAPLGVIIENEFTKPEPISED